MRCSIYELFELWAGRRGTADSRQRGRWPQGADLPGTKRPLAAPRGAAGWLAGRSARRCRARPAGANKQRVSRAAAVGALGGPSRRMLLPTPPHRLAHFPALLALRSRCATPTSRRRMAVASLTPLAAARSRRRANSWARCASSMCGPRLARMAYALLFTASNVVASAGTQDRGRARAGRAGRRPMGRAMQRRRQACMVAAPAARAAPAPKPRAPSASCQRKAMASSDRAPCCSSVDSTRCAWSAYCAWCRLDLSTCCTTPCCASHVVRPCAAARGWGRGGDAWASGDGGRLGSPARASKSSQPSCQTPPLQRCPPRRAPARRPRRRRRRPDPAAA